MSKGAALNPRIDARRVPKALRPIVEAHGAMLHVVNADGDGGLFLAGSRAMAADLAEAAAEAGFYAGRARKLATGLAFVHLAW